MDLSGGELQKAALFKVILTEPDVILLDEPTKGLDPFAKEELGAAFQEWTAQGKCLVLVTHDIEFSARYAHAARFCLTEELYPRKRRTCSLQPINFIPPPPAKCPGVF